LGSKDAIKGGTWHSYMADFPRTLRWFGPDANSHFRSYLLDDTMVFLAHIHPETKAMYPGLAAQWSVSPEQRTVYIKLNPKARWSDGNPVTSDDFLYSLYYYQSIHIQSPWMNNFFSTMFQQITRYDDYTFAIRTKAAKPDFAQWVLQMTPLPSHFLGELTEAYVEKFQWQPWPTTGPYEIKPGNLVKGRAITLTRVQDWWAADMKFFRYRFNPDRIQVSVIRDRAKAVETFRLGEIDQIRINDSRDWHDSFSAAEPLISGGYVHKVQFHHQHPTSIDGLYMNSHRAPFNNQDVRLGIQYASNWKLVIDRLYRGDYRRVNSWADGYGEFTNTSVKARNYDIKKARQHFANAGYETMGPDGILTNDTGQRLSLNVSFSTKSGEDLLTLLRQEALKAGLEFRLEKLDATSAWKKVQEKKHEIQYTGFSNFLEMYPRYWEGAHSVGAYDKAYLADGTVNPERKPKPQTNNYEVIALPEMDALIERYDLSEDKDEMVALSHEMYQILHDFAAYVPGAYRDFHRVAYWRWVQYPDGFNVKYSQTAEQHFLHWIDPKEKNLTLQAREDGVTFPASTRVFDQYKRL
jgi:microcin C transport system substrate-binding protein